MTPKNKVEIKKETSKELIMDLTNAIQDAGEILNNGNEILGYVLSISYNTKEAAQRVAFNMSGPLNRILNDVALGIEDANQKIKLLKINNKSTKQ